MKWIKIDENNLPKFGQKVFLLEMLDDVNNHQASGYRVTALNGGYRWVANVMAGDNYIGNGVWINPTHYCVPELPSNE